MEINYFVVNYDLIHFFMGAKGLNLCLMGSSLVFKPQNTYIFIEMLLCILASIFVELACSIYL
jgi:hypothetical protein